MEQYQKTHLGQVIGLVIALVLIFFIQRFFYGTPSFDEAIANTVKEMNKDAPKSVAGDLRFDSAVALPGKTIGYNFTAVKQTKDEVDIEAAKQQTLHDIVDYIKTAHNMKPLREYKVTFNYSYWDKNGVFLFTTIITPDMYQRHQITQ